MLDCGIGPACGIGPIFAACDSLWSERLARFFFDLNDGSDIPDEIGREIDDPIEVRREALRVLTALAAAEGEDAADTTLVLTVRDDEGGTRLRARLVCQVEEL